MPTFDHYSGTTDSLSHLRQFQDKITVYAHDDLLCRAFPSSLKEATYHWFYSLPKNSLRSFEDVTDAFYNQFASRREFQKNSNHLLMVKVKPGESLKNYVTYFQSHMVLMYNCNEDVAVATFISGLQVTHSFYKIW